MWPLSEASKAPLLNQSPQQLQQETSKSKSHQINQRQIVCEKSTEISEYWCRDDAYRWVAFVQIVFSVLALLIAAISLPVMYSLVQQTNEYVDNELEFCHVSIEDASIQLTLGTTSLYASYEPRANRTVRQYGGGGGYGATDQGGEDQCPNCCIPGPPGPRGSSGAAGKPGDPGGPGTPGHPGISPNATCPKLEPRPPPCRPCPRGPPGIKGWPGFPGDAGPIGQHGDKGADGDPGEKGETGPQGPEGFKGAPGPPGDKGPTPDGHIKPGPPGDDGNPGPIGPPGLPGLPGRDGPQGPPGEPGWPGEPGEPGEQGYPGPEGQGGPEGPPGGPGECVCKNVDTVIVVEPGPAQAPAPAQYVAPAPAPSYGGGGYGGGGGGGYLKDSPAIGVSDKGEHARKNPAPPADNPKPPSTIQTGVPSQENPDGGANSPGSSDPAKPDVQGKTVIDVRRH